MARKKLNIHIKPSKRGTFTAAAKRRGEGVQSFANKVLANKDAYSPAMVKKANFARNASKWNKELGGSTPKYLMGGDIYSDNSATQAGIQGVSAINPVVGGIASIGESIVSPIEQQAKRVNQRTGEYKNFTAARNADVIRSGFDPYTSGMRSLQDPGASFGEKLASFTGLGGAFSGKRLRRQEEERKKIIEKQRLQQLGNERLSNLEIGPQYQSFFKNGGKVEKETSKLSYKDLPLIQDPLEQSKALYTLGTRFKDEFDISKASDIAKDKKVAKFFKDTYEHPYTRYSTVTNKKTGESSYIPVLTIKEQEKIAKDRGLTITTPKKRMGGKKGSAFLDKFPNGGEITTNPIQDEYWDVSSAFLGNADKLKKMLGEGIIYNKDIPMEARKEALYANKQIMKELPLTMDELDDPSNINEMKYFNSLIDRMEGFLTPENIETATAENTLGNVYRKAKLLRQSPIRSNDLDSLQKYAPEFYDEFNLGLARPLLKSGNNEEFKNGGMKRYQAGGLPMSMLQGQPNAELEGGESLVTPDGTNVDLEGPSHEQGGIDMNLQPGTRIFSDTVKDPDNGKTFSTLNKKITNKIKKYQDILDDPESTQLSRRTAERMLNNLDGEQDNLFVKQERVKLRKRPINSIKKGKKFQMGGEVTLEDIENIIRQSNENLKKSFVGIRRGYNDVNLSNEEQIDAKTKRMLDRLRADKDLINSPERLTNLYNTIRSNPQIARQAGLSSPVQQGSVTGPSRSMFNMPTSSAEISPNINMDLTEFQKYYDYPGTDNSYSSSFVNPNTRFSPFGTADNQMSAIESRAASLPSYGIATPTTLNTVPTVQEEVYPLNTQMSDMAPSFNVGTQQMPSTTALQTPRIGYNTADRSQDVISDTAINQANVQAAGIKRNARAASGQKFGNALGTIGQLAPALYNIGQGLFGEAEQQDPGQFMNTPGRQAANRLRSIRPDISSDLAASRRATAITGQNIRQTARTRGELLSNIGVAQAQQAERDAAIYAGQRNMMNQLQAQAAGLEAQVGAQDAQMMARIADYNARSRAAQQGMLSTGISQVGQVAQAIQRRRGQEKADQMRMAALEGMIPNYRYNQATGKYEFIQTT